MITLNGDYYDGSGSKRTPVRIEVSTDGAVEIIALSDEAVLQRLQQQEIEVSSRLGNGPRYLELPMGYQIETLDNDSVDRWLSQHRPSVWSGLVHRLESNFKFVLLTLLLVIMVVWGTVQFGVPATAKVIAKALPSELLNQTSEETLSFLDEYWLEPSQLSVERQQELAEHFAEAVNKHREENIKVAFRYSEAMGPNAFALPNGQIIFTDAIVALSEHDDELLAILAHEIGHVKHRHSMRKLVQNSLFIFVLAMITGDMSGTSEVVLGLPVLFAELAYSRAYETESDQYALQYMTEHQIPLHRFSDIMLRLSVQRDQEGEKGHSHEDGVQWKQYLSTHPITEERIKAFQ